MTKEYTTKNRAKQFVCGHCNEVCSEEPCEPSDCDWMAFIDKEPAADVVEVVRCRDCKHSYRIDGAKEEYDCAKISAFAKFFPGDHFCGYGERKTDG